MCTRLTQVLRVYDPRKSPLSGPPLLIHFRSCLSTPPAEYLAAEAI